MAYQEFYCNQLTGSNLNGGSTDGAYLFEYTGGSWVAATGVFTVASGNPSTDGVAADMMCSVYATGATVGVFLARIISCTSTTITVDITLNKAGTAPVDGSGNRVLRVGGCWKGPNATEDFPFGIMSPVLTAGPTPRVNFKGVFNITGAITHNPAVAATDLPLVWQGYDTTPGDGVSAIIKGTTAGGSYAMLSIGNTGGCRYMHMEDFVFTDNGSTGSQAALVFSSLLGSLRRVKVVNVRGIGIQASSGTGAVLTECLVVNANTSNTANTAAFSIGSGGLRLVRCVAIGNNGPAFDTGTVLSNVSMMNCIAHFNTMGLSARSVGGSSGSGIYIHDCDFTENTGDAIRLTSASTGFSVFIENTNFIDNGGWAVNQTDAIEHLVYLKNCGFGSGTKANALGNVNLIAGSRLIEEDTVTYPPDRSPYQENGSSSASRLLINEALHAGRGNFGPDATVGVGYPDIGATSGRGVLVPMTRPNVLLRR